jgi:hypothetical protein
VCRGIESLQQELMESDFPCLEYLNVRKSKVADLHTLSKLFMKKTLTTLILDGQKIANTDTLEKLLGKERERDTQRQRDRHTDRQTERERDIQRERKRERDIQRERERKRQREIYIYIVHNFFLIMI